MRRSIFGFAMLACLGIVLGLGAAKAIRAWDGPPASKARNGHLGVTADFRFPDDTKTWTSTRPGILQVQAKAVITDKIVPESFHWFVTVRSQNEAGQWVPVHDTTYVTQPFRVQSGESAFPTFRDSWPMQPGTYHVVVGLSNAKSGRRGAAVGFREIVPAP